MKIQGNRKVTQRTSAPQNARLRNSVPNVGERNQYWVHDLTSTGAEIRHPIKRRKSRTALFARLPSVGPVGIAAYTAPARIRAIRELPGLRSRGRFPRPPDPCFLALLSARRRSPGSSLPRPRCDGSATRREPPCAARHVSAISMATRASSPARYMISLPRWSWSMAPNMFSTTARRSELSRKRRSALCDRLLDLAGAP